MPASTFGGCRAADGPLPLRRRCRASPRRAWDGRAGSVRCCPPSCSAASTRPQHGPVAVAVAVAVACLAALWLRRSHPVGVAIFAADDNVPRALRAGAGGFLVKDTPAETVRAIELFMSVATVKAHVSRLLAKLEVDNRVQIALLVQDGDDT
jgi:hypothetical protein